MNDTRTDDPARQQQNGQGRRLDSWKKIAAHFRRDITTVQRWERREGMPVHRHLHSKQGSVYAFSGELDTWWESRRGKLPESDESAAETGASTPSAYETPAAAQEPPAAPTLPRNSVVRPMTGAGWVLAGIALALILYAVLRPGHYVTSSWRNPLGSATFTRLTDWAGAEQAAEISRDGRWAAFLADRDGHVDAWLTRIGSGTYRNLTHGEHGELVNRSIRTLGFSADGSLVTVWTRSADGSGPEDIKLMAAATAGGELNDFLPGAAEVAWSHDGKRVVYHTPAAGDPLFVRDPKGAARRIYIAPAGAHCHFPLWSADDAYIYFVRGTPPDDWDIWRIRPSGEGLERITFHNSRVSHPALLDPHTLAYLASDLQGSGPWLYALNLEQRVPHRISFGLERYTSLAASADGSRLVATVDQSSASIWGIPLGTDPRPGLAPALSQVSSTGLSPRAGPDYLLYLSANAGRQSIWKSADGSSRELWSAADSFIVGAPSIAADGRQIAFTVSDGARTTLYAMGSDGTDLRAVTRTLELRGNPSWAPDGRSIVSAVLHDGEPRLTNIFLDGSAPTQLVFDYSIDPVWSPDGRFLIYSGADVGTTFPLRAVSSDGHSYPIPPVILTRGARRIAFASDGRSIVVLREEAGHKSFWLVDLRTGSQRQLAELGSDIDIRDFDLAQDGSVILFDRIKESSRIALIERGG
jgi:Tol biopolymer transport system component